MKSILLLETGKSPAAVSALQQCCKSVLRAASSDEARGSIGTVDAAVLHVPYASLGAWQSAIAGMRRLPMLWLCPESEPPKEIDWSLALDGVLFGSMSSLEMNVALDWGFRAFQQRKRWAEERDQLMQRIEERKWIDQAKAVLCEIKGISEAEAYDFLRKQAMNERKRIGEVSASIVKVYQLIHG